MSALDRSEIEAALPRKGFQEIPDRDHKVYKLVVDNKYTGIYTKTSRGSNYKTLSSDLVGRIARQLRLTTKEFKSLVDCPLSEADYLRLLRTRGEL